MSRKDKEVLQALRMISNGHAELFSALAIDDSPPMKIPGDCNISGDFSLGTSNLEVGRDLQVGAELDAGTSTVTISEPFNQVEAKKTKPRKKRKYVKSGKYSKNTKAVKKKRKKARK